MSAEKKPLLETRWELGSMQKFRPAEGEAPHYSVSIREEGAMPVRVVAKLDFGYGKATDEATARHIVDAHNRAARLEREHSLMLGFLKEVSTSFRVEQGFASLAQRIINQIESPTE